MMNLRNHFDLPEGICYLNNARMAPIPKKSMEAAQWEIGKAGQPYRIPGTDFFKPVDELKENICQLIDCEDSNRIAIFPSVNYGMTNIANNTKIEKGEKVIVVEDQFPSNVFPWSDACEANGGHLQTIACPKDYNAALWNQRILEAIDSNTAAVSIAPLLWSNGLKFNLEAIRDRCREVGAYFIVDGSQAVGSVPISIKELAPDALVSTGYKWTWGLYGMAFGYMSSKYDNGKPIENYWLNKKDSHKFNALTSYEPQYRRGAARYCAGEHSNMLHMAVLNCSIKWLNTMGVEGVQTHGKQLIDSTIDLLTKHGKMIDEGSRYNHLFGLQLAEGTDVVATVNRLAEKDIHVSARGKFLRISLNRFNTEEDIARLAVNL